VFLERIANGAPRFVVRLEEIPIQCKMQINKTSVVSEGARHCKKFSVSYTTVAGNNWFQAFQTTVSAQPICEKKIVNFAAKKLGRTLIASKDLSQSTSSGSRNFTQGQYYLQTWPRKGTKHPDLIFVQGIDVIKS
jgi:hypothetical protein